MASSDCKQNTDPLKLIRSGTSQDQRLPAALNPALPDWPRSIERKPEHAMVFARQYADFLQFYSSDNTVTGNWQAFFSRDISAQLAVAAIENVDDYRLQVKASFDFLHNNSNQANEAELKQQLGYLFSYAGSLARQLDLFKQLLPSEIALKGLLQNLIQRQLASTFGRLVSYYKADLALAAADRLIGDSTSGMTILGASTAVFSEIYSFEFSQDWILDGAPDWQTYAENLAADASVYGSGSSVFDRINHIATHNLFGSIYDQFLKALARCVSEAQNALAATFTDLDDHEPHYALFLAFLRLFEHVRAETDTLTQRHLDFYYRDILRLKERPAEPSRVHVLAELAKQAESHEIAPGALLKAGKDAGGVDAYFANDRAFVANKAQVTALQNVYRHSNSTHDSLPFNDGRLFAAPIANSEDGLGAKLLSQDLSWQPFFNKQYQAGELTAINMPQATVGFAVASHYLLLAEGTRTITLSFSVTGITTAFSLAADVDCLLTGLEGWFNAPVTAFSGSGTAMSLTITLDGGLPAVTPYVAKVHGFAFVTDLPIMRIVLKHRSDANFVYATLEAIRVQAMSLTVAVIGLKSLALSNDFGALDSAKPFQPFGAQPAKYNSLLIGSREAFQKHLSVCKLNTIWQTDPAPYKKSVKLDIEFLHHGQWQSSSIPAIDITAQQFNLSAGLNNPVAPFIDAADLSEQQAFDSASRHGFVRLKTNDDFGQSDYEQALIDYIVNKISPDGTSETTNIASRKLISDVAVSTPSDFLTDYFQSLKEDPKPIPPIGPFMLQLTMEYTATQNFTLSAGTQSDFDARAGHFYHLGPFGHAEQHGFLKNTAPDSNLYLLPPFKHINTAGKNAFDPQQPANNAINHEAEFYIGLTSLKPPQSLALLFQVADGTADPLSSKPDPHLHWSYLTANEWQPFDAYSIEDTTDSWLNSGIVTLAVPDDASADNTLLPAGQYWLRVAVAKESDAVCRLQLVAAQAFSATFSDQGNDPAFTDAPLLAGSIVKLDQPHADVKAINQPFSSFGGRGREQAGAFYTRISERLRHKDRAIALWDYERLLLEAFPQIYQVKCLNHTHYEPDTGGGSGIYKELAPGYVSIVTIPNQALQNQRDPLRPYTSLGLLHDIEVFMQQRLSCFVKLYVKNPLFEEVGLDFKVRFHAGFDETFYANQLNDAITRFLSPWAFTDASQPSFGGKIYRSVLLNFVEEQPYVDYVTDFKLSHHYQQFHEDGSITEEIVADSADVQGSKAVSLLVSAREHVISVINPAQDTPGATCACAAV